MRSRLVVSLVAASERGVFFGDSALYVSFAAIFRPATLRP